MLRKTLAQAALALSMAAMLVNAPVTAQGKAKLSAEKAHKIGIEAVVYGLPLVIMDLTKRVSTNVPSPQPNAHAPIN